MHVQPVINTVQAALRGQAALAGNDPTVEAAAAQLVEALTPALRLAAMDLAEQAAAEVGAQLPDHTVAVVLVEHDPSLRVSDAPREPSEQTTTEDLDARITLRLPPSLKQLIEDAAQRTGESVNGWVVDSLGNLAKRSRKVGSHITQTFDL